MQPTCYATQLMLIFGNTEIQKATLGIYRHAMKFVWDTDKADVNRRKHGVEFDDATTVFGDPLAGTFLDPDHSIGELRLITVGKSSTGRLLVVSHTEDSAEIRIISARPATAHERKKYES